MLSILIDMVSREKPNLTHYFQQQQWQALEDLLHKLHGGCSYCGVPELQKQVYTTHKALEKHDIESVKVHFPNVIKAINDLLEWNSQHNLNDVFKVP